MYLKTTAIFLICSIFSAESGFVDNLPKCALADNECMRNLYETVLRVIGKNGISELGFSPLDPLPLKNVSVIILDFVSITLVEGVAVGIKDCRINKFSINITEGKGFHENTCDITIKGHYKALLSNPVIKNILGGNTIQGDGNGTVKLEKLRLKFDFPFFVQLRDDGEIYMKCIYEKIKYDYEILGKTTFHVDNIYMGDREISTVVTTFLNENWRFIMNTFGKVFIDKAMEFYYKFSGNFFDAIPAKYYISDDLTPYARKQF